MKTGTLDRRITINTTTVAQDGAGQPIPTTVVLATVWAKVDHLRGREPFQGGQFNAQRVTVFTIRYRTDVDETMTIEFDGETYDIQSVTEIGRGEGLEIATLALVTA